MITNIVRPYEISIWTLQDEFISVLKPYELGTKEQVQNAKMSLKDDGENTFSFEVPMYLYQDGKYKENPSWYSVKNGNLLINMRKIKVIFNKFKTEEQVFEFIILRVTETHEGYERTCEVECEGLAFHELGRQGYKVVLSADEFDNDWLTWEEGGKVGAEPISNIDYWVKKVLDDSIWTYEVKMDWSAYPGVTLSSNKIYNEAYVSSWTKKNENSNILIPSNVQPMAERVEIVESSESNRYNLLQSIAEQFQVFTKFVYSYDDNYHIVGRKVVFYNSFFAEKDGFLDLTYAYGVKSLSREMDGTDLVTKMYVKTLEDSGLLTGEISIADSEANKSLEDYIFNFEYLHNIGTITDEQYAEITSYEESMHNYNKKIIEAQEKLIPLNIELPIRQAKQKTAEDAIPLDIEGYNNAEQLYNSITDGNDVISITEANPKTYVLLNNAKNKDAYYINLEVEGIISKSIKLYYNYDQTARILSQPIKGWEKEIDEYGNIIKIKNITKKINDRIYAIFDYKPALYYENVKKVFAKRQIQDTLIKEVSTARIGILEAEISSLTALINNNREAKVKLQQELETILGPAIREGNWQPEDQYSQFKKSYTYEGILRNNSAFNDNLASIGWDDELFAEEEENFFYNGLDGTQIYFPCIDLSSDIQKFSNETFFNEGIFCYDETSYGEIDDPRAFQYYPFHSRSKFAFLKHGNTTIPVLMITDVFNIDDFHTLRTNAWLGTISTTIENNTIVYHTQKKVTNLHWIDNLEDYELVFPRFKVNSVKMLNNTQDLNVYQGSKSLTCYEDYYVNFKNGQYYITIKPEKLISSGGGTNGNFKLNFNISSAAEAIYLDAIEVLKENSYPKVSYDVTPALINQNFINTAYNSIGQLVHINDYELKFENVMGYISEVELDLDHPWEDSVIVKNYKTKFEDLFSTIVAQTETMKSNSLLMVKTATLFTEDGGLDVPYLQEQLFNDQLEEYISGLEMFSDFKTRIAAIENKSILASSNALKIMNGNIGLAFPSSDAISNIELNRNVGLLIEGFLDEEHTIEGFFRVTNGAMGFFKKEADGTEKAMLYFDAHTGDLALAGTIYARNGWFGDGENGWVIGCGETLGSNTYAGGLLYSMNQRAIFSAGTNETGPEIALFNAHNEYCLRFQNGNLAISGNIYAFSGWFGSATNGWIIGNNITVGGTLYPGGIMYSANGKAIFNAGTSSTDPSIILKNSSGDELFSFKDNSLTVNGTINADSGTFGPWTIGANAVYRNVDTFGAYNGMYLGKEGISLGSLFQIHFDETDYTFDYLKISGGTPLTDEDLDTVIYDENGHPITDLDDDDDDDYLIKIAKEVADDEGNTKYVFSVKDIKLNQDLIDSIISNVPEGVYKTTDITNNIPDLPSDAPNGSLGVLYSDTIENTASNKKFQLSVVAQPSNLQYLEPGLVKLKTGTADANKRYNRKYFSIKATTWNAVTHISDLLSRNTPWVIVGMNRPDDQFHAMLVKVQPNKSLAKNSSFTLRFNYRTMQAYRPMDQLSDSRKRSRGITVNIYKAGSNGKPTSKGVAVASGTYKVPFTSGNINDATRLGKISLTNSKTISKNSYYYVVFYSKTPYSKIYIDYDSVCVGKNTSDLVQRAVYVKSADAWHLMTGSDGLPSYILPQATSSLLGGIKVGTGLSMASSTGVLSVKEATSSTLGGIKVGNYLTVNSGTLSVQKASTSNYGVMKVGSTLSVSDGVVNYNLPTASSSTLGGITVGSGLSLSGSTLSWSLPSEISVSKITIGNLVITDNRIETSGELRIVAGAHMLLVRGNTVLVRSTSDENGTDIQSW